MTETEAPRCSSDGESLSIAALRHELEGGIDALSILVESQGVQRLPEPSRSLVEVQMRWAAARVRHALMHARPHCLAAEQRLAEQPASAETDPPGLRRVARAEAS